MACGKWSIEKRVKCVRLFSLTNNVTEVQRRLLKEYGSPTPTRNAVVRINKLFEDTGSVLDAVSIDMCRKACENVQLRLQACVDLDGASVDFAMENR